MNIVYHTCALTVHRRHVTYMYMCFLFLPTLGFVKKCIQLYETTVVRHGLMLVGPTISGKTKCYEVLRDSLSALKGKCTAGGVPFEQVHTYVLNPKSITMGQLYGEFDALTHEWY